MEASTFLMGIGILTIIGLLAWTGDILRSIQQFLMPPNEFPRISLWQRKRRADKYPKEFCDKIKGMYSKGTKISVISKMMRVPVSTIYYIVKLKDVAQ